MAIFICLALNACGLFSEDGEEPSAADKEELRVPYAEFSGKVVRRDKGVSGVKVVLIDYSMDSAYQVPHQVLVDTAETDGKGEYTLFAYNPGQHIVVPLNGLSSEHEFEPKLRIKSVKDKDENVVVEDFVKEEREKPGLGADFVGGFYFGPYANFTEQTVEQMQIIKADLSHSRFHRTELNSMGFRECNLDSADFSKAVFSYGGIVKSSLVRVKMQEMQIGWAQLDSSYISHPSLGQSVFKWSTMVGTHFDTLRVSEGVEWKNLELRGVLFKETVFSSETLEDLDFRYNDFYGISFDGAVCSFCDFSYAKIHASDMNLECEKCSWSSADIWDVDFSKAVMEKNTFDRAEIASSDFLGARMGEGSFNGASIRKSSFLNAELERVDFSDASLDSVTIEDAELTAAVFQNTEVDSLAIVDAVLDSTSWSGLDLRKLDFSQASLVGATFDNCIADSSTLFAEGNESMLAQNKSNLTLVPGADFEGRLLQDLDLSGYDLSGANFDRTILYNVDFSDCNLDSALFRWADLDNVNFSNANMSSVVVLSSDFNNVSFMGADMGAMSWHHKTFEMLIWDTNTILPSNFQTYSGSEPGFSEFLLKPKTIFREGEFHDLVLKNAPLTAAVFDSCNFSHAGFEQGNLDSLDFRNSNLYDFEFYDLDASHVTFSNSYLSLVTFDSVSLDSAVWDNSTVKRLTIQRSSLIGADFSGALECGTIYLQNSNISDADLSTCESITGSGVVYSDSTKFPAEFEIPKYGWGLAQDTL